MDALPANRTWQPPCSHGTYQHKAITSRSRQLLMMGTWLPETCWATIRREIRIQKVISSWFFLYTLNYTALNSEWTYFGLQCSSISEKEPFPEGPQASSVVLLVRTTCRLKIAWRISKMIVTVQNGSNQKGYCPSATVSTTNLTRTDVWTNLALHVERPTNDRLS